jgi:hypothetical protein
MTDKSRFIGLIITLICVSSNVYSSDKIYKTNFPLTENTLHEDTGSGPVWKNGQATGVDWTNVKTSGGNATGTQIWDGTYNDSVSLLTGNWGPDQSVEVVVHAANQNENPAGTSGWNGNDLRPEGCNHELEIHLRGTMTAHSLRTYEILFSSRIDGSAYSYIGRWNGPIGSWATLYESLDNDDMRGADGDVFKATIVGYPPTINVYKNGGLLYSVVDTDMTSSGPITSGNPGIGFWTDRGCTAGAHNDDFGFTSFTATATETRVPNSPKVPNSPAKISISP